MSITAGSSILRSTHQDAEEALVVLVPTRTKEAEALFVSVKPGVAREGILQITDYEKFHRYT